MAEDTTGNDLTPEQVAAQEQEQKTKNQEEAFKRITEENKKYKEKEDAENKVKEEEAAAAAKAAKAAEEGDPDMRTIIREELNAKSEVDGKVKEVLTKYPELKEFEDKIREYLADDSRKDIPINEVISGAVGLEKLLQLGALMGVERTKSAEATAAGGGDTTTTTPTEEDKVQKEHMDSLPDGFK